MARQSLMWTTLPNGLTPEGDGLRVSVMLSPRLDTLGDPPRLDSVFPDWRDWPATLAAATFTVHYNGGVATIPAAAMAGPSRVDPALGPPDSDVWNALFHAGTFVRPFEFKDLSG